MNKLKVISVKGSKLSLWLKHHDPLDIGGNNILYDKLSHMWPGQIGQTFDNYIGVLSSLVECGMPMDRTDGNFNYFNFYVDPIPKVEDGWNRSLEEIFIERAEEIWSMDRPVRLWWSGGIDSTAALVAFLRTKKPEHKLTVYLGEPCKKENPDFWELLCLMDDIEVQFNTMETIFEFSPNWCDGSINVTGEPGDPVWGTFAIEEHIHESNKHWTDVFNWDSTQQKLHNINISQLMEFCERFNAKCPIEVRNAFDFLWWIAFAVKWQWNFTTPHAQLVDPSNYQNMLGFYNFPEIQKWSIHNHDLKHKGTWKSYKGPSKDFIYAYDGNADYRDNKTKDPSFPKTYPMKNSNEVNYATPFINELIMSDGSYHKANYSGNDYGYGYDPDINFYDKWDIYNKPVWDEWKRQL